MQGLLWISQNIELSGCCAGPFDFVQSYGMQHDSENPLFGFFSKKSRRSQWRTQWKFSPRHFGYGKAVPRQVDLKYVGRILLDTEEGCMYLTPKIGENHMSLHFRVRFLPGSWARKLLFCLFKFLCIFETLADINILYTYLNSA